MQAAGVIVQALFKVLNYLSKEINLHLVSFNKY